MYNAISQTILAWGEEALEKQNQLEKDQDAYFLDNFHLRINEMYQKRKHNCSYKNDVHDTIALSALEFILKQEIDREDKMRSYYYSVVIPAGWDYNIREELIRPFLTSIGLIDESDSKDRLLFFTTLEATFYYHQSSYFNMNRKKHPMFGNGKEYIMYGLGLTLDNKLLVNLDLFSAQYPPTKSIDSYYVPKVINSIEFTIPFYSKIKISLETCLQSRGFDTDSGRTRKIITTLLETFLDSMVFAYSFKVNINIFNHFYSFLGGEF